MAISRINIEGFRCFEHLAVTGLERVNVIVGANNSGKSALLEGLELAAASAAPRRIFDLLARRGQLLPGVDAEHDAIMDLRELVYGRPAKLGPGDSLFRILSSDQEIDARTVEGTDSLLLVVEAQPTDASKIATQHNLAISSRMGIPRSVVERAMDRDVVDPSNVVRVGSQLTASAVLRRGWGIIAGNASEDVVTALLQTFDPSIQRLVYSPESEPAPGLHGWYLRRRGSSVREALSGQGEGIKRLVALGLALTTSAGGTLMIDEVENGMHFSVMPSIWRFVLETARSLNVQVFMTSHSRDFIDAFLEAERELDHSVDDVAFLRLERGRKNAVRMSREVIASFADTRLDIR